MKDMVRNVETWRILYNNYMSIAYTGTRIWTDSLLHSLTLISGNKYRTFKGDRKMYGSVPHSNETDR